MRRLILLSLLAACGRPAAQPRPSADRPAAKAPAAAAHEPSRFELYAILLAEKDRLLSRATACEGVVGVDLPHAPTLGDWIAYNLSILEGDDVALPTACTAAGADWDCSVEFRKGGAGDESPWNWGVRFRVHEGALVADSLTCTGAG